MDKLTGYIQRQRSEFDSDEPSTGHSERFLQQLQQRKSTRRFSTFLVASAAAVTGLILTAGLSLVLNYSSIAGKLGPAIVDNTFTGEMRKIDEYYSKQIIQRKTLISNMIPQGSESLRYEANAVFTDVQLGYLDLRNDMIHFAQPDRSQYALTEFYRKQIEVLDDFIVKLKTVDNK
jgi:hypothetical protein